MAEQLEPEADRVKRIVSGIVSRDLAVAAEEEELERQKQTARRARIFKQDVTEWLVAQSLGADISHVALHRYVRTEIYVATTRQSKLNYEIATAFDYLLKAAGFEPLDDSAPKFGSIYWERVHRTKSRKSAQQLDERLALIEVALTNAFIGQGAQINGLPAERDEMEKTETERKAELEKISKEIEQAEAEIQKAKAETEKAKAEADKIKAETEKVKAETAKVKLESKKTLLELAHTLAKVLVKAAAGFAIIIGTLHISAPPTAHAAKPAIVFKIESHRIGPDQAKEVTGSVWLRAPEKDAFGVDDEEHDPLDPE